jgi:hypothetical protein
VRRILCTSLFLILCSSAARAEDLLVSGGGERPHSSKRVWIRRATLIAGCAASLAFDTITTRRVYGAGGIEANGILADSQGRPQWGRVVGMKAGSCAVSAVLQETHTFGIWQSPAADRTWTFVNLGIAAEYTWAGFHNLSLANSLSTPSFPKP